MNSLITIITPAFNKARYISETIESVLKQSYPYWQLIIINDLSTDNTEEVVLPFVKKDNRILYIRNSENKGANYCRNIGIEKADGQFIIFLDADDILLPYCLEKRLSYIFNSEYDLCVCTLGTFKKRIGDCAYVWIPKSKNPLADFLSHRLPWNILQPIWKKEFLRQLKGFDLSFQRLQDVELHTRALLHQNIKCKMVISSPDCYFRIDEGRKNFNTFVFIAKWISSAKLYYLKFYPSAKALKFESLLSGTIFKSYLQLLYHYKNRELSKEEFILLQSELLDKEIYFTKTERLLFSIAKKFNLMQYRIPGINFIINSLLIR